MPAGAAPAAGSTTPRGARGGPRVAPARGERPGARTPPATSGRPWNEPSPELGAAERARKMEAGERGAGSRAGSSADSLAEEEDEEDEEVPGSGRSSRTSSLVSGLLTELYSAAEVAAPPRVLRELRQQRPSRAEYLRLKGTGRSPPLGAALGTGFAASGPEGRGGLTCGRWNGCHPLLFFPSFLRESWPCFQALVILISFAVFSLLCR